MLSLSEMDQDKLRRWRLELLREPCLSCDRGLDNKVCTCGKAMDKVQEIDNELARRGVS
jgi:hypothetical protein